jgi:hypothetical protein
MGSKSSKNWITNKEEKMRNIFETAQKMKNGTIKPAKVYESITDFATELRPLKN